MLARSVACLFAVLCALGAGLPAARAQNIDPGLVDDECRELVKRLRSALGGKRAGPPTLLSALPEVEAKPYPVSLDETWPAQPRRWCLSLEARFQFEERNPLGDMATRVHVLFRNGDEKEVSNIRVGRIKKLAEETYVNLQAFWSSEEIYAGINLGSAEPEKINERIVWLGASAQSEKMIEVVLCEGPCAKIVEMYAAEAPPGSASDAELPPSITEPLAADSPEPPAPQVAAGDEPSGGPAGAGNALADGAPATAPQPATEPARQQDSPEIPTQAQDTVEQPGDGGSGIAAEDSTRLAELLATELEWELIDVDSGAVVSGIGQPEFRDCDLSDEGLGSKQDILDKVLSKCVRLPRKSGYTISRLHPGAGSKIVYDVKSDKPNTVRSVAVYASMGEPVPITKQCSLHFTIEPPQPGVKVEGVFANPEQNIQAHTFEASLQAPLEWRGSTLVLQPVERADCKLAGDGRYDVVPEMVTVDRKLMVRDVVLSSALGNAVVALNTFVGVPSDNGSASTKDYYPMDEDNEVRVALIKAVSERLKGHVKTVDFIANDADGLYTSRETLPFFDPGYDDFISKHAAGWVVPASGNFDMHSVEDAIKERERERGISYNMKIVIGPSGLRSDEDYCKAFESTAATEEVYIYSFATTDSVSNPNEQQMQRGTRNFPALRCPEERHFVLFPGGKRAGWEDALEHVIDFQRGSAGSEGG